MTAVASHWADDYRSADGRLKTARFTTGVPHETLLFPRRLLAVAAHRARRSRPKYQAIRADLKTKQTEDGGDYKKKNPLGYVPALELDDGTMLFEGPAIVQYIADKAPEKHLAPANGSMDRYKLQSWLNFVSTEMHKGFSPLFNPAMPDDAKKHRQGAPRDALRAPRGAFHLA